MKTHKKRARFTAAATVLVAAVVAAVGFTVWFAYHSSQLADANLQSANKVSSDIPKLPEVTDFASCQKASGSKILQTYPEQCVTKAGKTLTDPGISPESFVLPKDWSWYSNTQYKFKMAYPDTWGTPKFGTVSIKKGLESSIYFHSAPQGVASGIMATIEFDSTDAVLSGCNDATGCHDYGTSNTKAQVESVLKNVKINNGKDASGPTMVFHDASSFLNLITNTGQGATDVLDGQQIVSLPSIKVEAVSIDYEQLNADINCTQRAASPNAMKNCITQNDIVNVSKVLKSIQTL